MSFLRGCFLFLDGALALLFYFLFNWFGWTAVAVVGAGIIAIPIWICLIHELKKEERERKADKGREQRQAAQEAEKRRELQRRNTPCLFQDGISQDEFERLALRTAKRIKRLTVCVSGPVIRGDVESQSGISTWSFEVDFNDFGHITGSWWMIRRENWDSSIPNRFADLMNQAICAWKNRT